MKVTFYVTGKDYSGNYVAFSKLLTGKVDGLKDLTFTRKRKPENTSNGGFSSELTFYGDGYDIIKEFLIDAENGRAAFVEVRMEDSCCHRAEAIHGIIRGDEIEWYEGKCFVKATVKEHSNRTKGLRCLASTMIWDDSVKWSNGKSFKEQQHPRIDYNTGVNELMLILVSLITTIHTILGPIIIIVSYIRSIVNKIRKFFGGELKEENNTDPYDLKNELDDKVYNLKQSALGTGRRHPSPLVRDYIQNACNVCGLTFKSSILNDPNSTYFNTVYLYAPSQKGVRDETSIYWIDENKPLLSAEQFLNEVKQAHNAEWIIDGTTLIYERKDNLQSQNAALNYSLLGNRIIDGLSYEWIKHDTPAIATFTYTEDFNDEEGNRARTELFTIDVDYNNPDSAARSGYKTYTLPFGAAAFTEKDNTVILLEKHLATMPKLLRWKGGNYSKARVENGNRAYRFIREEGHNIYADFFAIEDPRSNAAIRYGFTFSFRYECDELVQFDTLAKVVLPGGTGDIEEITFKPSERTMTIKGKI